MPRNRASRSNDHSLRDPNGLSGLLNLNTNSLRKDVFYPESAKFFLI